MAIELPKLPFEDTALQPYISSHTLSFHYGKHHQAYVDNTNKLIAGTDLAGASLEQIVRAAHEKPGQAGLFNNAAQAWNHDFYWRSIDPRGTRPHGALASRIQADFGSLAGLEEQLQNAAVTQFGSGWAWLVYDGGRLQVLKTANADTPMALGQACLLTIDVWEHAYYLDYQNRRPDYVKDFVARLLNWEFATANLERARQ